MCVALSLGLAACSSGSALTEDCHWIGSVNPLTGGLGPVGFGLENAAKLAVQDVNRVGGVAGKNLCIATGDDRTDPDRAASVVDTLIRKHDIRAVNGAAASSATLKVVTKTAPLDMALVSCCSTSPELTMHPEIYRTVPSDALQGVALAGLAETRGAKRLAIIYLEGSYGAALAGKLKDAFQDPAKGQSVIAEVAYQERKSSYVDVVNMALSAQPPPDFAVLIAYPVEGAQIIRDWQTSGVGRGVKWLGTDGLKDDNFVLEVGALVPDLIGTAPIPYGNRALYDDFVANYRASYGGETPGIFTSNQYDAVILIALGIAKAGAAADPKTIKDAIPEISRLPGRVVNASALDDAIRYVSQGEDVDYEGVSGPVNLDDNGDVVSGYRVWSIGANRALQETDDCYACSEDMGAVTCDPGPCP